MSRRKLTPRDLRNPKRKSGYNFVATHPTWATSAGERFRAQYQRTNPHWYGPTRSTPLAAAQDYCDYINGREVEAPPVLKTAGHDYTVDETDHDPEYEAALGVIRDRTAQRAGKQGYVYLIIEDQPGGGIEFGKVGFSTNPPKRVAELQTGNPRPLRLLYMKPGTEADEKAIHQRHIDQNVLQEWFRPTKELLLEWDAEHRVPGPDTTTVRRVA